MPHGILGLCQILVVEHLIKLMYGILLLLNLHHIQLLFHLHQEISGFNYFQVHVLPCIGVLFPVKVIGLEKQTGSPAAQPENIHSIG